MAGERIRGTNSTSELEGCDGSAIVFPSIGYFVSVRTEELKFGKPISSSLMTDGNGREGDRTSKPTCDCE